MRSCIIVGSGRSGTSMVAGALRDAGYYMGHEPLASTASNPKGYFEDRAVNELNEELLAQVVRTRPTGRRGRLLPPYPQRLAHGHRWLAAVGTKPRFKITPAITARMRALTATRPFCLKDPRFCYTLEQWRPVLGDAVFVCVFREPSRTAASIIKDCCEREYLSGLRMTRRRALRVWSLMYRHVLDRHRHLGEWGFVHYDQFLDGSALPRLERLLDARIDAGFADARLKRSSSHRRVPASAAALYDELCELASFAPPAPRRARPDALVIPSVKGTA